MATTEYFEDVTVGETTPLVPTSSIGTRSSSSRHDTTHSRHTDEAAAASSMFGSLVASGWHTGPITMWILVDNYFADARALGAVGIDDRRFVAPVRPEDELSVETESVGKDVWADDRGLVRSRVETTTEDGRSSRWSGTCSGNDGDATEPPAHSPQRWATA